MSRHNSPGRQEAVEALSSSLVVTVEQAAAILGIGRNAAYDAVKQGSIPSIRIGGRIVVPTAPVRVMLGLEAPASINPASGGGK